MQWRSFAMPAAALLLLAVAGGSARAAPATALYNDQTIKVDQAAAEGDDLWVAPEALKRINGFELKPEGVCLDKICIPVEEDKPGAIVATRDGRKMVSVSALARKLKQAYAADPEQNVWSFGAIPAQLGGYLDSAVAPDFALADRKGKVVHLSDFKGKKVLLVTWASW